MSVYFVQKKPQLTKDIQCSSSKLTLIFVLYGTGHGAVHKATQFSLSRQSPLPSEPEFSLWPLIALLQVSREKVVAGQLILVLVESELHGRLTKP